MVNGAPVVVTVVTTLGGAGSNLLELNVCLEAERYTFDSALAYKLTHPFRLIRKGFLRFQTCCLLTYLKK